MDFSFEFDRFLRFSVGDFKRSFRLFKAELVDGLLKWSIDRDRSRRDFAGEFERSCRDLEGDAEPPFLRFSGGDLVRFLRLSTGDRSFRDVVGDLEG